MHLRGPFLKEARCVSWLPSHCLFHVVSTNSLSFSGLCRQNSLKSSPWSPGSLCLVATHPAGTGSVAVISGAQVASVFDMPFPEGMEVLSPNVRWGWYCHQKILPSRSQSSKREDVSSSLSVMIQDATRGGNCPGIGPKRGVLSIVHAYNWRAVTRWAMPLRWMKITPCNS